MALNKNIPKCVEEGGVIFIVDKLFFSFFIHFDDLFYLLLFSLFVSFLTVG